MPSHHHKKKKHKKQQNQPSGYGNCKEDVGKASEQGNGADDVKEDETSYLVKRSEQVGRYLVAARDLKAGEVIIETPPLVVGPCAETEPVCLGCHSSFTPGSVVHRCDSCNWQLCAPDCHGLSSHRQLECIPLRDKAVHKLLQSSTPVQVKLMYEAVLTLRCMLLKTIDPANYDRLLDMDPLNDVRHQIPKLWNRNQKEIVQRIRSEWGFAEDYTEQELHTICGIIEVNAFEVGQDPIKARALFPKACLLMHDCTPNTGHTDELQTHHLTVRVLRYVKAGEPLTLTYAHILQGTLKRRQHLKEEKFFDCNCRRCTDATELGTYCSAFRCSKCRRGLILPVNPLNQESEWRCHQCSNSLSCESVILLLEKLSQQLESICSNDVGGLESFLHTQSTVLHANHYLLLSVKHSLCELYGKIEGYLIPQLSQEQLKRKETLCRDLLEVVDQLEPGLSRLRGTIMYEMHVPLLIEAGQLFQGGVIQRTELRRRLKEVQRLLSESERILSLEPEGSPEYGIAEAARDALKNMGDV
ncbi:SET domain-containing protein SmydA-8-like [Anopheles maculipalpis]|uniref:SET domain-containing protein SmydA-8-like n=1 Tax=Anopheles maculipalpis TaxID=1496333 RepID=UPI002158F1B9|nr:SET domain-containing protein SmydA-8-like [Anopheles maculipalpis]